MIRTYTDVTESRTTRDKGPLDTTAHLPYFAQSMGPFQSDEREPWQNLLLLKPHHGWGQQGVCVWGGGGEGVVQMSLGILFNNKKVTIKSPALFFRQ